MQEYAQDALTYVRRYGRPDLFINFTCHPDWKEIKDLLFSGQQASDRHNISSRVFNQKHSKLMDHMVKWRIFGFVKCYMYTIEWQKRGLPHILIWLEERLHSDHIDSVISAELLDLVSDPKLFDSITKSMIHGPCGNFNPTCPCMDQAKYICTKKYSHRFIDATVTGFDG